MLSLKLRPKPSVIPLFRHLAACGTRRRHLTLSPLLLGKQMPPRPSVREEEIEESFLKGSGPGGQKINKTSSAVQLKHLPTGIVVKSQATRSRSQNRKIARRILAEKLEFMERGEESRMGVIAERDKKRKQSKTKKAKRKYSKLDSEKCATDEEREGDEGGKGRENENDLKEEEEDVKPRAKTEETTSNELDVATAAEAAREVDSDMPNALQGR